MSRFKAAQRSKSKLRMAIDGPAGSGKSFTALRFAFAIASRLGNGRVAAIDAEYGSLSKYASEKPDGIPFEFDALELTTFSPTEYTAAIEEAGRAGYDVLVVDGLSPAWQGKEGALELVSKKGGNSFTAWKDVTPMHTRMIEAILASPMHVIVTMRAKTEYVMETDERGKQVPRKIGVKPIQREGMEYEFDVYGSMDWAHFLTISKSRCSALQDAMVVKPGAMWLEPLIQWLDTGIQVQPKEQPRLFVGDEQLQRIVSLVAATCGMEKAKKETFKRYSTEDLSRLTPEQAKDYEQRLQSVANRKKQVEEAQQQAAATEAAQGGPTTPPTTPPGIDMTSGKTQAPDAAPPPKEPRDPKALTEASWRELAQLRGSWCGAKGIGQNDTAAIGAAWKAKLADHGATSAKEFDFDRYWTFRRELESEIEAFEKSEQAKKNTQLEGSAAANDGKTFQQTLTDANGVHGNGAATPAGH